MTDGDRHNMDIYFLGLHVKLTAVYNCLRLGVTIYTVFTVQKFIVTIIIMLHALLDVSSIKFSTYHNYLLEL
jgi:hypothetical protein